MQFAFIILAHTPRFPFWAFLDPEPFFKFSDIDDFVHIYSSHPHENDAASCTAWPETRGG